MKRILIFGMTEVAGGIESFLMNYYRHMDHAKIQFDFLCNSHNPIAYEDEILAMGGRTYHITARSNNFFQYHKELKEFYETYGKNYDTIWVNVNSLANIDYLKAAKKYGIKKRIIHSHNAQNMDSKIRGLLHKYNKKRIQNYATDFWACSKEAAEWFYSDELMSKAVIINNAVDVKNMQYNKEAGIKKREEICKLFHTSDSYIIGNVGRLHFQKNQMFILDVFSEVINKMPEARLVLIGIGPDEEKLKEHSRELNIEDKIVFLGQRDHIQDWLSAMNLFLFPSVFEGFSVAALEAQANGIPVLASQEASTKAIQINSNYHTLSLKQPLDEWVNEVIKIKENDQRDDPAKIGLKFIQRGLDIDSEAGKLQQKLLG
jgi:glycosyltransferase involved in cell wall biosynthesis